MLCGGEFLSNAACKAGHFICDSCHSKDAEGIVLEMCAGTASRNPVDIMQGLMELPGVHMHGPEHHFMVGAALLAAYHNSGGGIDLRPALEEMLRRGKQVPGGTCGYWGVCGAAAGAGIYMSILLGSNPVHKDAWPIPQRLVADCLNAIADVGGPRCCKRTGRLAITRAAAFTEELLGVEMPLGKVSCRYFGENRECLFRDCPYFPVSQA